MKQHIPGFLIGALVTALLFVVFHRPGDGGNTAHIEKLLQDSARYVHAQDSFAQLHAEQRKVISAIRDENVALTLRRNEADRRRRTRPASDYANVDSARAAALRAVGIFYPIGDQPHHR